MPKHIIKWQKFFAPDDDSNSWDREPERDHDDSDDGDGPRNLIFVNQISSGQPDYDYVSENFNIWTLHANFDLIPFSDEIANIDGVETIAVVSRYRIKVAFGTLFDSAQVKLDVEEFLLGPNTRNLQLDPISKDQVAAFIKECSEYPYWILLVVPNGRIKTFTDNEFSVEYKRNLELFKEAKDQVGGHLLYSEEDSAAAA